MSIDRDAEHRRWVNAFRFRWHEKVIADRRMHTHPTALVLAGHIMHRYDPQKGYAQLSFASAEKALNVPRGSIIRARDHMELLNWIETLRSDETGRRTWKQSANRYQLRGGPEDLDLMLHRGSHADETTEMDSPP